MAKRNDKLKGYGKNPTDYTWHYEMVNSAKNSMGAGKITRYTSTDGTVTGKFQYLVTDGSGAELSAYTVNGTAVDEGAATPWLIPAGGVFGPFKYLTSFTVNDGKVLAFEPEL